MTESQSKKQQWLHRIRIGLDIYAILIILFLLLMLIPERPVFVEMFCNFLSWVLLPSVLVFIVMIAMRKWRSVALWTIPTFVFLYMYGGLFLPAFGPKHSCPRDENSDCVHIRVMTFNLRGFQITDRQGQIDLIKESGADIIALQEVDQIAADGIVDQLTELYPYQLLEPEGIPGTGILSKYPMHDAESFTLSSPGMYHSKAIIDVEGHPIILISGHPPPPITYSEFRYKDRKYSEIVELVDIASGGGPALLLGDYNTTDQSTDYRVFTGAGLSDTWREVGWGFGPTWPNHIRIIGKVVPILRIDYIWHTNEFEAISASVGLRTVSDHRPVIADLAFTSHN